MSILDKNSPRVFNCLSRPLAICCCALALCVNGGNARAGQDDDFVEFLNDECNVTIITLFNLACAAAGLGGGASAPPSAAVLANLGVSIAQSRAANLLSAERREYPGEQGKTGAGGGSGDSGWGLLIAPQYGESKRDATDLETGFDSTLAGMVFGIDYAYSPSLLVGAALGVTSDEADFDDDAGTQDTDTDSLTFYLTWAIDERSTVDVYLMTADSEYDTERRYTIGDPPISSRARSSNDSSQTLIGGSYSHDWLLERWTVGAFVNIDYLETDIDSYRETDLSGFGLIFPDQETESLQSMIGVRFEYARGNILPNFRLSAVHEFEDDAREIDTRLVLAPGSVFTVRTDDPDRDFLIGGAGVVGILGNGSQWFVDYEQRFEHDFLDNWSISAGLLYLL